MGLPPTPCWWCVSFASYYSPHSWYTYRRNDGEMGRPVLQEMFREYIKWQLERSWPIRSWRPLKRTKLPSWHAESVQYLQDIPRMARYEVTFIWNYLHLYRGFWTDPWLNSVRPVQLKALLEFSLTFCSRMHILSWGHSSAQQCLLTRKTYLMPITGSLVSLWQEFFPTRIIRSPTVCSYLSIYIQTFRLQNFLEQNSSMEIMQVFGPQLNFIHTYDWMSA